MSIHSTAIIGKDVVIDESATVGPYSIIKGKTTIGAGTVIEGQSQIGSEYGVLNIGKNNHIFPGAMIGGAPQDKKYKNENTELIIGDNNIIREFATLNIGTVTGGGKTIIGDSNLFMSYVHIAHDCILANHIVVANSTQFAGHVIIEDNVTVGGCCALSQFIRLGKFSYIGGDSTINKDILPYAIAEGKWAVMRATNKIGLSRNGYSKEDVDNIHKAIRFIIKGNRTLDESVEKIKSECNSNESIDYMLDFIKKSEKGLAR